MERKKDIVKERETEIERDGKGHGIPCANSTEKWEAIIWFPQKVQSKRRISRRWRWEGRRNRIRRRWKRRKGGRWRCGGGEEDEEEEDVEEEEEMEVEKKEVVEVE